MKKKIWIGIDPGQRGGIVAVDRLGQIVEMFVMPKDPMELFSYLSNHSSQIVHACVEKSHACRPGQSTNASFTYGYGFGLINGCLIFNDIPYSKIPPRTWQKTMISSSRSKDPKAKALASANKVFKKTKLFWIPTKRSKNPHNGLIDAALIAEFCRRTKPD